MDKKYAKHNKRNRPPVAHHIAIAAARKFPKIAADITSALAVLAISFFRASGKPNTSGITKCG